MDSSAKTAYKYDEAAISRCIELVTTKQKTLYAACKAYGIPQSTVRYRLSGKWSKKSRKGPHTVLTADEEDKIVRYLLEMQMKGYPVVMELLLNKVKTFFDGNSRPNPFTNNVPGRKWIKGFLRRKSGITLRKPESVSSASAKVKEDDIRGWFAKLTLYLEKYSLMEATLDPTRIYNGDETSFFLHPQTKAVLAGRGSKNVYECEHADGHKNITVMFTFGADGSVVPPDVIFPMQRLSKEILRSFPGDWGVGKSEKGWMDAPNFMLYIHSVFHPYLKKKKVKFPVLFFVDGHSSHTASEVAELCFDLGIILIALYPNTTRITQPADVAIFKPLKSAWQSAVAEWRIENAGLNLSLQHFPGVLQTAMDKGIKKTSIINGFKVCGLFPFGADRVDYGKCIAKPKTPNENANNHTESGGGNMIGPLVSETVEVVPEVNVQIDEQDMILEDSVIIPTSTINAAINCIGRERINEFSDVSGNSEEGQIIRQLYDMLLLPFDSLNQEADRDIQVETFSRIITTEEDSAFVEDSLETFSRIVPAEADSAFVEEFNADSFEVEENNNTPPGVLQQQNRDNFASRKMSISELLQTPPTPRRSNSHRNYKRKFYPVLTASERLEEIHRLEEEKENEVAKKKARVEERKVAKIRTEQLKHEKAEMRKRRQEETEQRKCEKQKLRQQKLEEAAERKNKREKKQQNKTSKANLQKQHKMELLEALKLKQHD